MYEKLAKISMSKQPEMVIIQNKKGSYRGVKTEADRDAISYVIPKYEFPNEIAPGQRKTNTDPVVSFVFKREAAKKQQNLEKPTMA